ncbi:SMI1/KNR4 family protein [Isobaculum melis]|uniref:SMI1 / KNR4 family (SUKH-1) n=1 Tax=Isobaculum melis TaxID=142588 RepID=A0A1H9S4V4_9LACT|nr:SMI1/KNR4 family protein [Isobaculum melis]SER79179.1 SMI1 / KNR4 family (SUKH-1) [Isobaculum melis]
MKLEKIAQVDENELKKFLAQIDFELPKDYLSFITENNGVRVENGYFYVEDLSEFILMDLFLGVSQPKRNLMNLNEEFEDEIPKNSLLIARDPGGGFILQIHDGENDGIYYYDHQYFFDQSSDEENTYFIAQTFSEFLHLLETTQLN